MTRRSTAIPKGFVVRHQIPEGMEVSLKGLGGKWVALFGVEPLRRAGVEVWDEKKFWEEHKADVERRRLADAE